MHRIQELVRLHRLGGSSVQGIAARLKMSPNTERVYRRALIAAGLLYGSADTLPELEELKGAIARERPFVQPPQQQSSIAAFETEIKELLSKGLGPKAIHDRLRLQHQDYLGRLGAVKRMVRRLRCEAGISAEEVAIPVETSPGHVAQVDFGYAGYLREPDSNKLRRAWVFVMVLGYSRHMYIEYVFDQRSDTWARLHVNAFKALGGVPAEIVPDNLKAAVLTAAFSSSEDTTLNRTYRELAGHYGFKIGPTPPHAPKKKGKVESAVKYVKSNFGKGREGEDITRLNEEAQRWVREIAGTRSHGSTGQAPLEVFEQQEQATLLELPREPYRIVVWHKATVLQDCHFHFDGCLYSVPWRHIAPKGQPRTVVWVRATVSTVTAYIDDTRVADHERNDSGRRCTKEEHLPEHRRDYRHRDAEYWRKRAAERGTTVRALIDAMLEHDPVQNRIDVVCASLKLLESLPPCRAESVADHALRFGNVHYGELRRIVERELDRAKAEGSTLQVTNAWGDTLPSFARSGEEFLARVESWNSSGYSSRGAASLTEQEVNFGSA